MIVQQIVFIVLLLATAFFFSKRIAFIRKNILSGRAEKLNDQPARRWKYMALYALGQKKMFKRIVPAVFHFMIYAGFIIINLEIAEIMLDGILGTHRLFVSLLGPGIYGTFISLFEVLALLVIVACLVFLARRWVLHIGRFFGREMTRWPKLDATLILIIETVLMTFFLSMNTADSLLQDMAYGHYREAGFFLISDSLKGILSSADAGTLVFIERFGWWAHIVGVFAFSIYITYSKHLHIFLAFPNAWYTRFKSSGKISNMPEVAREVKAMMDPSYQPDENAPAPERFGAKDVTDLSWKSILDAYSCTECGRCTSECPANLTGKLLSPRKIMMDTRDRSEELGYFIRKNGGEKKEDGKSLLHDYISMEELNACTTCQACVEACPVSISPLDIIIELRRYLAMEESKVPSEWALMFGNIENNGAPWQFSPSDRLNWKDEA